MLLWLVHLAHSSLSDGWVHGVAALEKITLRASLAAIVSFVLAVLLGARLIGWLQRHFREPIKSDSPRIREMHRWKAATPTMGGLFLVAGLVVGVAVFGDLANGFLQVALLLTVGLALVGFLDDLIKLRGTANGLSARAKFAGQWLVAATAAVLLYQHHAAMPDGLQLHLPMTTLSWSLGPGFIPLSVLVIVGFSNAVNLTDGLDGLAGGCLLFSVSGMAVLAYASGHAEWAAYLNLPRIPGSGEMTVLAGAMIGGVLGFLWFNCHPAQVFMGDTGSLPLGGLLGLMAVVTRQEVLLLLIGGVFAVEAASVAIQVVYYKWRRRRIFLCAPLHHHFQFQGWPESRIVVRFWIASALCALLGLATLKWNIHDIQPPVPPLVATAPTATGAHVPASPPTLPGTVR
jgi:phospho-N-acetylmuramoyl-pentapeptide-transferase